MLGVPMRILIVDDEREYGLVMFNLLSRLGHDPVIAFDPCQALSIAADTQHPVAGVITDIEMPGMSGVDLARAIRDEVDRDMPIAFCTGSDPSDEVAMAAATLGPVLAKAAPLSDTRAIIKEMISLWARPRPQP